MKVNSIYQTPFGDYIDLDKIISMDYMTSCDNPKEKFIEDFKITIKCQLSEPIIKCGWFHEFIKDEEWKEVVKDMEDRESKIYAVSKYFKGKYFDVIVANWKNYNSYDDKKQ